jgi:general nucleoside transport system ATP-binding protein
LLVAKGISKRFGRTVALDGVDFEARAGEIHALLGENGAGKTTLMNIFAGSIRADAGAAMLDGIAMRPGSSQAALRAGIAAVHQSPMLFERFTWEENLALGGFGPDSRRLGLSEVAARARRLAETVGFKLPPDGATVEQRTVAERVRLEVLRALSFNPRVLILDEPTGVLPPSELASFLDSLRRLRAGGRIVLLVTHKLAEALAVADRITVLRHGKVIATTTPSATSERELARLMVGEIAPVQDGPSSARIAGEPVLEIAGLALLEGGRTVLDGINLVVRRGEIVGIAGVDGNGQEQLVAILAGARRHSAGRISVHGGKGASDAVAVIPQNRDLDGLILDMALWENLLLARPIRKRMATRGWVNRARAIELCRELLARFRIRADDPEMKAAALSGGNRQRLEVARAMGGNPRLIVAHDVTRGLDLVATAEVHRTLASFAAQGGAVLLISTDLDELLSLCDRIAVISNGRLRETSPEERNPERLGLLMAGAW